MLACGLYAARRAPLIGFGLLWIFVALSVESSFFPIRDVMNEHRVYLAMPGAALVLAFLLVQLQRMWPPLAVGIGAAVVVVLTGLTIARNEKWQSAQALWQDALTKGVPEPGLVIAVADFLALAQKWEHVAEFLEAVLRQGVVVRPWMYEALALALRESKASPEEIERAEVSYTDLEPLDGEGFRDAAHAMAGHKRYDRAVAFCRQAAVLAPDLPQAYADALGYAELAQDAAAMEWAASALLKRDWPVDNHKVQAKAQTRAEALAKELDKAGQKEPAERIRVAVRKAQRRDLEAGTAERARVHPMRRVPVMAD